MRFSCRFIIPLTLFLSPVFLVNGQGLKGRITDSKGEPLPYATIYIRETRLGTATNTDGLYEISLPVGSYSVVYQYLGYKPVEQHITIGDEIKENNVSLSEQVFEMPEIVVRANEKDRAWYIMRKAIGMAPWHLKQIKSYEAEVYIKGGGVINRLPRLLKRQMNANAGGTDIKEGQYYYYESVNVITFTAPDKYVHRVVSSRTNMPSSDASTSPMDFIEASFYQPVIAEMAISPLAPNAFQHYNFKFLGSTRQGLNTISKIQVTPKRKSQQLFSGTIFIVEDEWAIQSLDLVNENMMGTIRVKQLYLPVENNIWMPVSHDFKMDISIMGVKAVASYLSSVKYTSVEPDRNLPVPSGMITAGDQSAPVIKEPAEQETMTEIEEILSKDKISVRDMNRLSRLNEKISVPQEEPLEIKETTTYVIDKDATLKDSSYWEKVRPIPLTSEERASIPVNVAVDTTIATPGTLTVSIGGGSKQEQKKKSNFSKISKAVISGRRWELNENNSIYFDGLASVKTMSFNTVDGFTAGTGLTWIAKTGENSRFNLNPSIRYAFNRQDLMWSINSGFNWDPVHQTWLFLRFGSMSRDFSYSGVNPFINTVSSLVFRYNWMKLYHNDFINLTYRTEVVNGLGMSLTAGWQRRSTMDNVTDFSFFRPDRDYTVNVPDNPFVRGDVDGFGAFTPANHSQIYFTTELTYTTKQRYRMRNSVKVNVPSENPVYHLIWKHGYNYNDTLSGHFDFLKAEVTMSRSLGAMRQVRWNIAGGGFINGDNLMFQDFQIFNTQQSPVLINNYNDAFMLKRHYAIATPSYFGEAHLKYTSPCLLIKRLPVLSRTLMRENVSLSWLYTPEYSHYTELGYSVSEIFLMAEAGVYAGFRDFAFDGIGLRFIIRLK